MHASDEELISHILGIADAGRHIEECRLCSTEIDKLRVSLDPSSSSYPDDAAGDSVRERLKKLETQKRTAESVIAGMESSESPLFDHEIFWTEGGISAAAEWLVAYSRKRPLQAMALANSLLARRNHVGEGLQAELFRVAAVCARSLSAFETARMHLDEAEEIASGLTVNDFLLARIWYQRAAIALATFASEPTTLWAERAAEVFGKFGASTLELRSKYLVLCAQYRARNYRGVLQGAEQMISQGMTSEEQTLGAIYSLIGRSRNFRGEPEKALEPFAKAIELFENCEMPSEVARSQWGLGISEARVGDYESGIGRLRSALAFFSREGMKGSEGMVRLDLAEALILAGEHEAARRQLLAGIDRLRGMLTSDQAQRALAFLRESSVGAAEIGSVSAWIAEHQENPEMVPSVSLPC